MRPIRAGLAALLCMLLLLAGCRRTLPDPADGPSRPDTTTAKAAHFAGQPLWETTSTGGSKPMAAPEKTLTKNDLLAYQSPYSDVMADIYKSRLTEQQTLLYQTILYAADNGYPYLDFPLEWANGQHNLWDIYSYVALDSPLVESNVRQADWIAGEGCLQLGNPAFAPAFLDKKKQALEKARAVVKAMPDRNASAQERARYCYDYLVSRCVYEDYTDNTVCQSYVYDALCEGRGICDGFSNALTLLLQCSGIPAFEKMRLGSDTVGHTTDPAVSARTDRQRGHVWVSAIIDGVPYNLDPTYDIGENGHCQIVLSPYWFLFPDGDAEHQPVFAGEWLPACQTGEAGAFVRDVTVLATDDVDTVIDRAVAFMEQHRTGGDAYVRLWFRGGAKNDRIKAIRNGLYKRVRQLDWPMGYMMAMQQGDMVAITYCPAYAAARDPVQTAAQLAESLQQYNDAGYGHAVVQFDAGDNAGEELISLIQQEITAAGMEARVFGEPFDGGDDRFAYWQYWLPKSI